MKTKGLMALGLRRLSPKIWTGSHYKYIKLVTLEDHRTGHFCENSDGSEQWFEEVLPTTLHHMGLEREEKTDRIVKLEERIEQVRRPLQ
jgi:hypothetical protein